MAMVSTFFRRRGDITEDSDWDGDVTDADMCKPSDRQLSQASTAYSLEELSSPAFFSRQCTEIDSLACRVALESSIKKAMVTAAVLDGSFCITVANPRNKDVPLIAVSEQFEAMTGYSRAEMLGKSCRFLNEGCVSDYATLASLRRACQTGSSFTGVLANKRKSGDLFLNLLDLHGLTVARNHRTGEHLWFLIGIHADVSQEAEAEGGELPQARLQHIHEVASSIRSRLAEDFSRMAVSEALLAKLHVPDADADVEEWVLLPTPVWIGEATRSRAADLLVRGGELPERDAEPEPAPRLQGSAARWPGRLEPAGERGTLRVLGAAGEVATALASHAASCQWLLAGSVCTLAAACLLAGSRHRSPRLFSQTC